MMGKTVHKFNHTAHKELWGWLAKNPDKEKSDWHGWRKNGGQYPTGFRHCFACAYAAKCCIRGLLCSHCPFELDKRALRPNYDCLGGLFSDWLYAREIKEERIKFAVMIRNFPVRDDVECI